MEKGVVWIRWHRSQGDTCSFECVLYTGRQVGVEVLFHFTEAGSGGLPSSHRSCSFLPPLSSCRRQEGLQKVSTETQRQEVCHCRHPHEFCLDSPSHASPPPPFPLGIIVPPPGTAGMPSRRVCCLPSPGPACLRLTSILFRKAMKVPQSVCMEERRGCFCSGEHHVCMYGMVLLGSESCPCVSSIRKPSFLPFPSSSLQRAMLCKPCLPCPLITPSLL